MSDIYFYLIFLPKLLKLTKPSSVNSNVFDIFFCFLILLYVCCLPLMLFCVTGGRSGCVSIFTVGAFKLTFTQREGH